MEDPPLWQAETGGNITCGGGEESVGIIVWHDTSPGKVLFEC